MYKVIKQFNGHKIGEVIELNERRAKSELRNGNVEVNVKAEKETIENKIEKRVYKNKSK